MEIHAARRKKDDAESEVIRWTVQADDYDAGRAEILSAVADDEVLMFVRPVR